MPINTYRIALAGLGNVGASMLSILAKETDSLRQRYGVNFLVTGVAELGGGAIDDNGLDLELLLSTLKNKGLVADLPNIGRPGMQSKELLDLAKPDFFLEATPVNLKTGEPGLSCVRTALNKGIHTILANKGPAALAFKELAELSDIEALADAQRRGIAETDPSLDVDGWDAAAKLVIAVNSVLGVNAELKDVNVQGIRSLTYEAIQQATEKSLRLVPVASAELIDGQYKLRQA